MIIILIIYLIGIPNLLFNHNIEITTKQGAIYHETSDTSATLYNLKCNDSTGVPCYFKLYLPSGKYIYADYWMEDSIEFLITNEEGVFITFSNYEQFKIKEE